uniref:Uncharacterized protein n=1 Tax=Arundo donax TaxID=35708 RepID=A0A0A9CB09_ARUDO
MPIRDVVLRGKEVEIF